MSNIQLDYSDITDIFKEKLKKYFPNNDILYIV